MKTNKNIVKLIIFIFSLSLLSCQRQEATNIKKQVDDSFIGFLNRTCEENVDDYDYWRSRRYSRFSKELYDLRAKSWSAFNVMALTLPSRNQQSLDNIFTQIDTKCKETISKLIKNQIEDCTRFFRLYDVCEIHFTPSDILPARKTMYARELELETASKFRSLIQKEIEPTPEPTPEPNPLSQIGIFPRNEKLQRNQDNPFRLTPIEGIK